MIKGMQADIVFLERAIARTAAGRIGTPDDLAGMAAFLASRASDLITGAYIAADGGLIWGA